MIVVLVILAILAAMMVPALLGWIDEARNKEYVLQARSVYMAAQALADEAYADSKAKLQKTDLDDRATPAILKKMQDLSDVDLENEWLLGCTVGGKAATTVDDYSKDAFEITDMHIHFKSNTNDVYAVLTDGAWEVQLGEDISDIDLKGVEVN